MAKTHRCVGDEKECEYPAVCEECGRDATPENPVLVKYDPADPDAHGFEFVCESCVPTEVPVDVLTRGGEVAYVGTAGKYDPDRDRYRVFNPETEDHVWVPSSFVIPR